MKKTKKVPYTSRLMKYVSEYKLYALTAFITASVYVFCSLYIPILIGRAIDCLGIALTDSDTGKIIEVNVDFEGIIPYLIKIIAAALIAALMHWITYLCTNKISYNVICDIRKNVFSHLQKVPLKVIDSMSRGDILSRTVTDIDKIADGLISGGAQLFIGVLTIAGTLVFMLTINYKITIFVVIVTPLSLFVARFISKNTFSLFKKQSEADSDVSAVTEEMIGGYDAVKSFAYEDKAVAEFNEKNEILRKRGLKATFFSSLTNPCTRFVNGIVYAGVAVFGAMTVPGSLSVGLLSSFLTYANQYTKPFNEISGVLAELQSALASAQRVFELIDIPEETDEEDANVLCDVDGSVSFKNVFFSYDPDNVRLIENFSIDVKPGQRIALVGPTGCGKTTVINLLMRFYDTISGKISVSGENISELTRDSLRSHYGMVLQETWLKNGTIKENIAFGKPDATDDEIIAAAKAAHAHSFIKRLPGKYDSVVTEDGGNLSQGQKQLICIARVMLALPPMLILDEATSSIDTMTEMRIQKAFSHMMNGRTSFIVAHRLSTIREADCILVMKAGKIIEQGTHEELLAVNGFYAELYNSQFK